MEIITLEDFKREWTFADRFSRYKELPGVIDSLTGFEKYPYRKIEIYRIFLSDGNAYLANFDCPEYGLYKIYLRNKNEINREVYKLLLSDKIKLVFNMRFSNQYDFASAMGVSNGTITNWFYGRSHPSTIQIYDMSQILDVDYEFLIDIQTKDGFVK